ncbi:disease resistance protein [Striga asiatica]|uniref:Disease resistance protein n=1 Tax=Striga asiatica TaxID=4170 RepID=A0A5A7PNB3_STRAF|nr:disease resistance protein [Striga asiatica]
MAYGAVTVLLENLSRLLTSHSDLISDKLKPVMDELIRMGITRVKIAKPETHEAKSRTSFILCAQKPKRKRHHFSSNPLPSNFALAPRVRGDNVVGLEDEQDRLMHLLTETLELEELNVITIIGMPGLGKTTLARKVYETEEIIVHFPSSSGPASLKNSTQDQSFSTSSKNSPARICRASASMTWH